MRQQLDKCILNDKCFQYFDDVGTAATDAKKIIANLKEILECIRKSGLKLSPQKCEFGKGSVTFLGSKITSSGMAPITEKTDKFLHSLKPQRTLKQVRRFIGFCQFYKAFIPRLAEKLLPLYQLLKSDTEFVINCDHISTIEQMKKELKTICESSLRLPKKGLQYVILADASFYAAEYVLMTR